MSVTADEAKGVAHTLNANNNVDGLSNGAENGEGEYITLNSFNLFSVSFYLVIYIIILNINRIQYLLHTWKLININHT